MRTFRRTRLFAATGVALAALALTACEDGTGTRDEGASAPAATPAAATPTASGEGTDASATPPATDDNGADTDAPNTDTGTGTGTDAPNTDADADADADESEPVTTFCNGANTKVTAQPVPRPLNHMLLTVTNTGSKPCSLMYHPVLRFDEMQWVPQADEDTKPQAVPTLAPGESGYAGVLLAAADGSGDGGMTGRKLTVAFQGGTPNSSGGASATPPLPSDGLYYDSSLSVTYWQSSMEDALN
ncbi:DUF4232 domain-containing protein [Streptomyces sp. NPDC001595]|uniref:DUF4232 domain-containing protein n=1 Tax=Streptomyces sp. NPDC001532 TaxID=3154520 RepID=UPI0033173394